MAYTDDFERPSLGADWSVDCGVMSISAGHLLKTDTFWVGLARYLPAGVLTDCQVSVSDPDYITYMGPAARLSANGLNGYAALWGTEGGKEYVEFRRYTDDANTIDTLDHWHSPYDFGTISDIILTCAGSTFDVSVVVRGVGTLSVLTVVDATFASGYIGVCGKNNVGSIDAWNGGAKANATVTMTAGILEFLTSEAHVVTEEKPRSIWLVGLDGSRSILRNAR